MVVVVVVPVVVVVVVEVEDLLVEVEETILGEHGLIPQMDLTSETQILFVYIILCE